MVFLRTGGMFVHPDLYEILYRKALELVGNKERRQNLAFANADGQKTGEGSLETSYRTVTYGAMGGIEFEANLAIEGRSFNVAFVIDERYLGEFVPGYWTVVPAAATSNQPWSSASAPN